MRLLHDSTRMALVGLLALGLVSCVVPVRSAPGVEGRVTDRESGRPVEGAIVVVRWDTRHGDELPDRDRLAIAEAVTDAKGRFSMPATSRGGVAVYPFYRSEARVVGVIHPGYRCPSPARISSEGTVEVSLSPTSLEADRRDTCRPVQVRRGEADAYMAAWREIFPAQETVAEREEREQVERLVQARAALGFGENCEGPVYDLALAPDGGHAAYLTQHAGGATVHLAEMGVEGPGPPEAVKAVADAPPRRLAWTRRGELVLWQPSDDAGRAVSASIFARGSTEVLWTDDRVFPAALDPDAAASGQTTHPQRPLEPADLSDEADTRWNGRSFALTRTVDPMTGLPRDSIRVAGIDGLVNEVELPGEACGGPRFGRPHYRIDSSGDGAIDLRFVDGGCHAVRVDLETGHWIRVDQADEVSVCRGRRRMPPGRLETALRGWTRELREALVRAGADPDASFALEIDAEGKTRALAHNYSGEPVTLQGPSFPIDTPLQRIDVTNVAPATRSSSAPPVAHALEELQPL